MLEILKAVAKANGLNGKALEWAVEDYLNETKNIDIISADDFDLWLNSTK